LRVESVVKLQATYQQKYEVAYMWQPNGRSVWATHTVRCLAPTFPQRDVQGGPIKRWPLLVS